MCKQRTFHEVQNKGLNTFHLQRSHKKNWRLKQGESHLLMWKKVEITQKKPKQFIQGDCFLLGREAELAMKR